MFKILCIAELLYKNNAEIKTFSDSLKDLTINRLSFKEPIKDLIQEKQNPEKGARYKKHARHYEDALMKITMVIDNSAEFGKTLKSQTYTRKQCKVF